MQILQEEQCAKFKADLPQAQTLRKIDIVNRDKTAKAKETLLKKQA
jgi:hypothetical protein